MRKRLILGLSFAVLMSVVAYAHWPEPALDPGARADRVEVSKSARTLSLLRNGEVLRIYHVTFGGDPVGHKTREGDEKTPEGLYTLDSRNPGSRFHRSIHVSYPNEADRENARRMEVSPGGAIMIHGLQNGLGWIGRWHRMVNWTDGCIAVTNREMGEIWRAVPDGTPIEIRP